MGLKDLSDTQLESFLKDPKAFLSDGKHYDVVFDLTDPKVKARVEQYEKELHLPHHSLQVDHPVAAK